MPDDTVRAKEAVSFRLRLELMEELRRRAAESGLSATALAERYLDEGLRHEEHPLILFRDGAGGRRPALIGTRLDVGQVIDTVESSQAAGPARVAEAAEYLGLAPVHILAAVRYYADYQAEVDDWRNRVRDTAERERSAWEREQAILA